jgi:hypothetical protein
MKTIFSMLLMCLYVNVAQSEIKAIPLRELSRIDRLIKAVQLVESNNNPLAVNVKEKATGSLQIRPILLIDYNRRTGNNYYLEQMKIDSIAIKIFKYYACNIGYENEETIARFWNGGYKKRYCRMTDIYWNKVKEKMSNI